MTKKNKTLLENLIIKSTTNDFDMEIDDDVLIKLIDKNFILKEKDLDAPKK